MEMYGGRFIGNKAGLGGAVIRADAAGIATSNVTLHNTIIANNSEKFVPFEIEVPEYILLANPTFQFDFVEGFRTAPGQSYHLSWPSQSLVNDGRIRIWNKDGNQTRSGRYINDNYGNLVENTGIGVGNTSYTAQNLGFLDFYGNLNSTTVTLYIEGYSLSSTPGNHVITVGMDYLDNGQPVHVEQAVKYTRLQSRPVGGLNRSSGWKILTAMSLSRPGQRANPFTLTKTRHKLRTNGRSWMLS